MVASPRPVPALTLTNTFFWTSGKDGVLRFKRCQDCGTYVHPPGDRCVSCLGAALQIEPVSGRATVAAYTINHHQWHPAFPPPYVIAIVEIAEAPYVRLTTNIVDCKPEDVAIGMPVEVRFLKEGEVYLPVFRPVRS